MKINRAADYQPVSTPTINRAADLTLFKNSPAPSERETAYICGHSSFCVYLFGLEALAQVIAARVFFMPVRQKNPVPNRLYLKKSYIWGVIIPRTSYAEASNCCIVCIQTAQSVPRPLRFPFM